MYTRDRNDFDVDSIYLSICPSARLSTHPYVYLPTNTLEEVVVRHRWDMYNPKISSLSSAS